MAARLQKCFSDLAAAAGDPDPAVGVAAIEQMLAEANHWLIFENWRAELITAACVAVACDNLPFLDALTRAGFTRWRKPEKQIFSRCASFGRLNFLEWLRSRNFFQSDELDVPDRLCFVRDIALPAATHNQIAVLDWVVEQFHDFIVVPRVFRHAASLGQIAVLDWASRHYSLMDITPYHLRKTIEDTAKSTCGASVLPWLLGHLSAGLVVCSNALSHAAASGNLAVIDWLMSHNLPANEVLAAVAAVDANDLNIVVDQAAADCGIEWLCLRASRSSALALPPNFRRRRRERFVAAILAARRAQLPQLPAELWHSIAVFMAAF